jgi:RNA polymerase sigma-70 factor (ECF subfamily)
MDQESIHAAFLESYELHADEIYRFCLFKVSNKERAEDLTQEVFTELWQALRKETKVKNTRAFLYTIARNRVIDWYRRKKSVSLDAISDAGVEFLGDSAASVTERAEFAEVLAVIDELDEASRDAVLLRYVESWTPQEIADLNNESANAVSVRLNRAIKKIQDVMQINQKPL